MPTALKPVFKLKKGFGHKYRWSAMTLSKADYRLVHQVAGAWGLADLR